MTLIRGLAVTTLMAGTGALSLAVAWAFYTDPTLVRWVLGILALFLYTGLVGTIFVVGVRAGRSASPAPREVDGLSRPALGAPAGPAAMHPAAMQAYMAQAAFPDLTPDQWQRMTGTPPPGINLAQGITYPGGGGSRSFSLED